MSFRHKQYSANILKGTAHYLARTVPKRLTSLFSPLHAGGRAVQRGCFASSPPGGATSRHNVDVRRGRVVDRATSRMRGARATGSRGWRALRQPLRKPFSASLLSFFLLLFFFFWRNSSLDNTFLPLYFFVCGNAARIAYDGLCVHATNKVYISSH